MSRRPSGIEWVSGTIPSHWRVRDLMWCCSEMKAKNTGNRESNVLSLSYGKIIRRDVESNHGLLPESFETYQVVDPGNIVLRLTDLQNDKRSLRTGLVHERGIITSAYVALAAGPDLTPEFLHYILHSYDVSKVFYGFGGGVRQSMKFEDLKHVPLLLPPLASQKAIAVFLDRKTAAIDALIEKKQKLLDLLAEKRAALINQAVTKGLDPNVPMKDSAIPWIGEIPTHWDVKRLKTMTTFTTSGSRGWAEHYTDDPSEPVFLQSGNLGRHLDVDLSNCQRVSPPDGAEGERTLVFADDVLVCITGGRTGSVAIVEKQIAPKAYINQHVCLARLTPTAASPRFIGLGLASKLGQSHFQMVQYGGTKQGLGLEDVRNCWLAVPPRAEQDVIASVVWSQMRQSREIQRVVETQLERIQEYRQALITAAVTGQLDIPEETP